MFLSLFKAIFSFALSYILQPKEETPEAATSDDINVPIVREGTEIGKGYGTFWISAPHVAWWGDFLPVAVYRKVKKK